MDKNREFADLVGICRGKIEYGPHGLSCCDKCKEYHPANIPDYAADPRLVLREMIKRSDWQRFNRYLFESQGIAGLENEQSVPIIYIDDTTGKLRDMAIQFMRKEKP